MTLLTLTHSLTLTWAVLPQPVSHAPRPRVVSPSHVGCVLPLRTHVGGV